MTYVFLLMLFVVNSFSFFQSQAQDIIEYVPKDYILLDKNFGDLNHDSIDDVVLIIKKTDEKNIELNRDSLPLDKNRRGIIVLFKSNNGYEIADKNYSCFESENEDGGGYFAPEMESKIKDNKLIIHYFHGRYGYWKFTFQYQNSNFELIEYDNSDNTGPVINSETHINFITKKKLYRKNTNENAEGGDEIFAQKVSDVKIEHLIILSKIKDFNDLDEEMMNY